MSEAMLAEAISKPVPEQLLMQMMMGKWVSKALSVAADLGVADHIGDTPAQLSDLAKLTHADPDSLYRLLRALSAVGVFTEQPGRRFSLTPLSRLLRQDASGSLRALARWLNVDCAWGAWGKLGHSVKTGKPGFDEVYDQPIFAYFAAHPDQARVFNDAMTNFSAMVAAAVTKAYDFSSVKRLCDVGGGQGLLLGSILSEYPHVEGTLFDLPEVVEGAASAVERWGHKGRIEIVGGDFFKTMPKGADAYIMKSIIHDWSDEQCVKLLSACREAMTPEGKVLVVEGVVGERQDDAFVKLVDLEMLVMTQGGRERTKDEFADLFHNSGLRLERIVPTESMLSVIEAVSA